ncbi:MAG: hypothetical protein ACOYOE_13470, partial [Chlorobium sp.]
MAAGNFALPILEKPSLTTNNSDISAYLSLITASTQKKQQNKLQKQVFFLLLRTTQGAIAQLVEHLHGMQRVRS